MSTITLDIVARDFASGTMKKVGLGAGGLAKSVAGLGGAAIVGGIAKSIGLAKDFDLTLRQVGVQTGQTGTGLKSLSGLAMEMGAKTKFSAKDAADGMLELAKGGLTAAQIKAGALNTTMTLAAAGGIKLGDSAGYVVQGMTTFGLKASQANQVAVALAGGANASTASVESLGQALSQVGPGAHLAGLSLQDTVAALSAFDNAGIKGSDAGTALKSMLTRLTPATQQQADAMDSLGLLSYNSSKAMALLRSNGIKPLGTDTPTLNRQINGLAASLKGVEPGSAAALKAQQKLMIQAGVTGSAFYDQNGKIKSLSSVSETLKGALRGMSNEQKQTTLTTMFGTDAYRAAAVLSGLGAKGVEKYTKAVNDQSTVQKMAKTSMEGAAGAWENFTGSVETAGIKLGTALLPKVTSLLNLGADLVNNVSTWGPGFHEALDPPIRLAGDLLGLLRPLGSVVGGVAHLLGNVPGPLTSIAVQGALAAVVLPRISSAFSLVPTRVGLATLSLRDFGAQLRNSETRGAAVQGALARVGATARNVSGVGGMLLLSQGAQHSSTALGKLATIAGGAATGFSMGGPWGAAIGGLVGGFVALRTGTRGAGAAFRLTKGDGDALRTTLDQVSGAAKGATRQMILAKYEKNGLLDQGRKVGLSGRTLVDATLGDPRAISQVSNAVHALNQRAKELKDTARGDAGTQALYGSTAAKKNLADIEHQSKATKNAADALSQSFGANRIALQKQSVAQQIAAAQGAKLGKAYRDVPALVTSQIKLDGAPATMAELSKLTRQFDLTPQQIVTTARLLGMTTSLGEAKRLAAGLGQEGRNASDVMNRGLRNAGNVKPNTAPFHAGMTEAMNRGRALATGGSSDVRRSLGAAGNVRPNMAGFIGGLSSGIAGARNTASTGGASVGRALKTGFDAGFFGAVSSWANQAATAVQHAIDAAKHQADSHSPSRKTMKLGQDVSRGFELGMQARNPHLSAAGADMVSSIVKGIDRRWVPLKTAYAKMNAYVAASNDKLKALTDARTEMSNSVVSGFSTSIFSDTPGEDDAPVTMASLLASQSQKYATANRVNGDIQTALGKGLSKALVMQLANAGSSGTAQLHAIATEGTRASVAQLNGLDAATTNSLRSAGNAAGNRYYGDSINAQAAEGRQAYVIAEALRKAGVGGATVYLELTGQTIVREVRADQKKRGVKVTV